MRGKNRLHELVKSLIDTSAEFGLTANMIADEAMRELDPNGEAHELMRIVCLSQLRQMAELALLRANTNEGASPIEADATERHRDARH